MGLSQHSHIATVGVDEALKRTSLRFVSPIIDPNYQSEGSIMNFKVCPIGTRKRHTHKGTWPIPLQALSQMAEGDHFPSAQDPSDKGPSLVNDRLPVASIVFSRKRA